MHARDFFNLASILAKGSTEAEWRSAVSRAYYAAFHIARNLLLGCGFSVPRGEQAHAHLWLRLSNSKHPDVENAGGDLKSVRSSRNWADYDLDRRLNQATALSQLKLIENLNRVLEEASKEPVKAQITEAMKTYERDVLKEVTWHS